MATPTKLQAGDINFLYDRRGAHNRTQTWRVPDRP